ncbi:ABC transporter ATP-binding protein [bacterium]|nr:ABC transporter ATP-binding protein [bacterium]
MEDIAISVKNVSKTFKLPHEKVSSLKSAIIHPFKKRTYEKQQVLNNISFDIKKGEFFGIVGRNGSGKSTLLKLLAGIYTPNSGTIHVNGKLTPFIELGVGFNPELTGRENVFLNGALLGFNRKQMDSMYEDIVAFAEIEKFMDQRLKNYSSGMQVRLAFSIAIRANSEILLLDEVLAVGDAAFQQKCFDYFEELKRNKKTVILVSHDMSAVTRFCNRAIYIKEGKIIQEGEPSDIADIYAQENIANHSTDNETVSKSTLNAESTSAEESASKISVRITKRLKDSVLIEFQYSSKIHQGKYIGFSIQKDGVSIAELTTESHKPLKTALGTLMYELDISYLNHGAYQIGAGLFKLENRELLAATSKKASFVIKGHDHTRGAAIKLADRWKYE